MTRKAILISSLLISYTVILSTLAIASAPTKSDIPTNTQTKVTASVPWTTIEAEAVSDPMTPMRRAQKAGPKAGEESPRKFPCLRSNPKTGKPIWKLCVKSEGYPSTDQRIVTELEQGGRPGATTVTRVN